MNTETTILEVVAYVLERETEEISVGDELDKTLGMDSMDLAELVLELEDRFRLRITDDELYAMKTVQDIVDHITAAKS